MDWGKLMNERELRNLLDVFSHKLKNPLHGMGLNLDVLRNRLHKQYPDNPDLLKHVDIAAKEAERLQQITLTFLDYLKMSDKEKQKVDLNSLLERGLRGK